VSRFLELPGAGHTFGATHPLARIPADLERVLSETTEFFARELS
jgi:hypothetical protein